MRVPQADQNGVFVSVANPYSNYSATGATAVTAWYEPNFLFAPGVRSAPAMYASEPLVVGLTSLEPYWINQGIVPSPVGQARAQAKESSPDHANDLNQGEWRAFTRAVASFLLDGGVKRKPVRVQVGWDSNDYQIDMGTNEGQAEYRRMLARDVQ